MRKYVVSYVNHCKTGPVITHSILMPFCKSNLDRINQLALHLLLILQNLCINLCVSVHRFQYVFKLVLSEVTLRVRDSFTSVLVFVQGLMKSNEPCIWLAFVVYKTLTFKNLMYNSFRRPEGNLET
jgi:hypothetical protein